jgi:hypothetical protein
VAIVIDVQHGSLIAVDNSITSPGVAVFVDGLLTASGYLRQPEYQKDLNIADRVLAVATHVIEWAIDKTSEPYHLVWEWPQIYTAAKSKGNPNDLLGVIAVGAAISGILGMGCRSRGVALDVRAYKPAEWIGQLPKCTQGRPTESPRAQRILARLDPLELDAVTAQHDAIDAIGLGLFRLGRLNPEHKYPGADGTSIEPPPFISRKKSKYRSRIK